MILWYDCMKDHVLGAVEWWGLMLEIRDTGEVGTTPLMKLPFSPGTKLFLFFA